VHVGADGPDDDDDEQPIAPRTETTAVSEEKIARERCIVTSFRGRP
jgi:hypothetical protein